MHLNFKAYKHRIIQIGSDLWSLIPAQIRVSSMIRPLCSDLSGLENLEGQFAQTFWATCGICLTVLRLTGTKYKDLSSELQ